MPKERPILFSAPMVCAILAAKKPQTRRVMAPQPDIKPVALIDRDGDPFVDDLGRHVWSTGMREFACPYGRAGDRLWVREAWALVPATAYRASVGVVQTVNPLDQDDAAIYRAGWDRSEPGVRWRPSIHMPRWASRILLEITDVRVERVRDVSEADALAEGVLPDGRAGADPHKYTFKRFWDQINAKRGYGWAVDPWVWVISFRRVEEASE